MKELIERKFKNNWLRIQFVVAKRCVGYSLLKTAIKAFLSHHSVSLPVKMSKCMVVMVVEDLSKTQKNICPFL